MDSIRQFGKQSLRVAAGAVTVFFLGYSSAALSDEIKVTLSGAHEIPPVTTTATGTATITVGPDKSISASLTTSGVSATAAHIHEAGSSTNGPVIIPLTKASDNVWTLPAGVKLTDAQYESYKAGNLYFNVHSAANKAGEIRGQIKQ